MTPIKCRMVYRVNKRGQITMAHLRTAFQSHVNAAKSRTLRVTPKGRAYLAALALENDEFEEGENA